MKVNHLELDAEPAAALKPVELSTRQEGKAEVKAYAGNQLPDLGIKGSAKGVLAEALAGGNVNCSITVPAGEKVSVWLHYEVTEENPRLVGQLKIDAQKGSELHVFELFDGDAEGGYVNLLQYIEAEEDAKVTISKVQIHGEGVRHIDQRLSQESTRAKVKFVSSEVGGKQNLIYVPATWTMMKPILPVLPCTWAATTSCLTTPTGYPPRAARPIRTF